MEKQSSRAPKGHHKSELGCRLRASKARARRAAEGCLPKASPVRSRPRDESKQARHERSDQCKLLAAGRFARGDQFISEQLGGKQASPQGSRRLLAAGQLAMRRKPQPGLGARRAAEGCCRRQLRFRKSRASKLASPQGARRALAAG